MAVGAFCLPKGGLVAGVGLAVVLRRASDEFVPVHDLGNIAFTLQAGSNHSVQPEFATLVSGSQSYFGNTP